MCRVFFPLLLIPLFLMQALTAQVAPPNAPQESPTAKPEEEAPPPPPATLLEDYVHDMVQGSNTFAYALYGQLKNRPGNLIFSPYCISTALAMPYAGAKSGTQNQMQLTLHYLSQGNNLYTAIEAFNRQLAKPWMQGPNEVRLMMANSLWVQRNLHLETDFLNVIKTYFGASLRQVDFAHNPDAARLNINDWVREGTHGRISNLIERSDISRDTRILLAGTIFMRAVWQYPFDTALTAPGPFFIDPKTTISVPMMTETKNLGVYQHEQFTMLELPYSVNPVGGSPQLNMLILLPTNHSGLSSVESLIGSGDLLNWMKAMQVEQVIVTLPRFKFTSSFDMKETLSKMGMGLAFSNLADFTGIFAGGGLALDKVLHKAYIDVDEKGTEAIAATAVSINLTSMQQEQPPVVFKADHPFIFVIVERATGAILFMGRFSVPT